MNNSTKLTLIALSISAMHFAQAAEPNMPSEQINPEGAYRIGSIFAYPELEVNYGHDDNITKQESNAVSSNFAVIKPKMRLEYTNAGDKYQFAYVGAYTRYQSSSQDDNDRSNFTASAENFFTERVSTKLKSSAIWAADARGANDQAVATAPDRYRTLGLGGVFTYGADNAEGKAELGVDFSHKRYLNNLSTMSSYNLDTLATTGRFFYRVAPKTQALLELKKTDFDYKLVSSTQDNSEYRALLGLVWDATASTSGEAKIGVLNKNFSDASRKDFTGISWEAGITWEPSSYSTYKLQTARSTSDSTGLGNYLVNTQANLSWQHTWSERFDTKLGYDYSRAAYNGIARTDDTNSASGEIIYNFRPWSKLSLEYRYTDRNSNQAGSSYQQNLMMANAKFGF